MISWLTKLIPMPWLYVGIAIAFAAMAGWTWIAQARMEAAQARERAEKIRADANTGAYFTLAELTKKQTYMITALEEAAQKRAATAKTAAQAARSAAQPHRARQTYYQGLKAPQTGQCAAAGELIREYAKTRAPAAADRVR